MSGDKTLHKLFGDQLQKQMDEDYIEMMKEEQQKDYPRKSMQKVQPAYALDDVFEYERIQKRLDTQRSNENDRRQNAKLIQPNDLTKPKTIMVMPNE